MLKSLHTLQTWTLTLHKHGAYPSGSNTGERMARCARKRHELHIRSAPGGSKCTNGIFTSETVGGSSFLASVRGARRCHESSLGGSDVNVFCFTLSTRSSKTQWQENESMFGLSKEILRLSFKLKHFMAPRLHNFDDFVQSYSISGAFAWRGHRSWSTGRWNSM